MINTIEIIHARILNRRPFLNFPIRRLSLINTNMVIRMTGRNFHLLFIVLERQIN
jgi:hypothetical protein